MKARTLNRLNLFQDALKTVDDAEKAAGPHIPKPMQAEASFVRGKNNATRSASDDGRAYIYKLRDDETACRHFQNALDVGRASVTFEISCRLQISDMLLRLGRVIEARNLLADARKDLQSVQHTFLHERIGQLEKRIDESKFSEFANGGRCRAEPFTDAANRTRIGTRQAQATRRPLEKPQVGDEARGSPPAGQHVFEKWGLAK